MDLQFLYWLQQIREALGPGVERVMAFLSDLSINSAMYVLFAGIYWCLDKELGQRVFMNIAGGNLFNQTLKNTFTVYRPWIRDARLQVSSFAAEGASGYSFPSGHSCVVTAQFGTVGLYKKCKKWLRVLAFVYVGIILFTRLYLGCHTPQDVLVGFGACFIWLLVNEKILVWANAKKNRDLILLGIGTVLAVLFLVYACLRPYPMDYTEDGTLLVDPAVMLHDCFREVGTILGFLVGWVLERHCVGFETRQKPLALVLRFVVGGVAILALDKLAKPLLYTALGADWGRLTFYFFTILLLMGVYPLLFTVVEKKLSRRISQ